MARNDGKPWTREDVKILREQARDRSVSTNEMAKNLGRTSPRYGPRLNERTSR